MHTLLNIVSHGIPSHAGRKPACQACTLWFCPFVFDILPIPDDIILPMQLCHHQEVFISQKISATAFLKFPEVLHKQERNNKSLNGHSSEFPLQIPQQIHQMWSLTWEKNLMTKGYLPPPTPSLAQHSSHKQNPCSGAKLPGWYTTPNKRLGHLNLPPRKPYLVSPQLKSKVKLIGLWAQWFLSYIPVLLTSIILHFITGSSSIFLSLKP